MNTIIKYSNCFGLALALCVVMISGCIYSAPKPVPDPLEGWQKDYSSPGPSDKIIEQDYQNYIQQLSPEEKGSLPNVNGYFKDGTGQHAVSIIIGINGRWWRHILTYDKDNKRIKTIKYATGYYAS